MSGGVSRVHRVFIIDQVDHPTLEKLREEEGRPKILGGLCGYIACSVLALLLEIENELSPIQWEEVTARLRSAEEMTARVRQVMQWTVGWREKYLSEHYSEFKDDGERRYFLNGMMGLFEVAAFLRQSLAALVSSRPHLCCEWGFLRSVHLLCSADPESERFECERTFLAEETPFATHKWFIEGFRQSSAGQPHFFSIEDWRTHHHSRPSAFIVDMNGHFAVAVLLPADRETPDSSLLHFDSLSETNLDAELVQQLLGSAPTISTPSQ